MTSDLRRAPGYALLAGAAGIVLLMLLWLATSGAQGGGVALGLLLTLVLAGPLAAAGWYVLSRAAVERVEEQTFVGKRRILESDHLFRDELSARLSQLASVPGLPSDELIRLAQTLKRSVQDEAAWYDAIHLDDAQTGLLAQYDDLVWEQVRWLTDHPHEDQAALRQGLDQLRQAVDRRNDLLVRGRPTPAVAPTTLLRAPEVSRPRGTLLQDLQVGDAITRDGIDYVVDRVASSFAEGETWKLAHLSPSGPQASDHWLLVSPGALESAWLEAIAPPQPGTVLLDAAGVRLPLERTSQRLVTVQASSGAAAGELVRTWRYRDDGRIGLVEQWPDGAVLAYAGTLLRPDALDIWPAIHAAEVPTS